jgi:hypothetical protein
VPCYRCGDRQADPEPGKPSPYRRGVIGEHQVLICPACQPAAVADLTRCTDCGGSRLIRRLDQIECLDCHLIREAGISGISGAKNAPDMPDISLMSDQSDAVLADEVTRALERLRRIRRSGPASGQSDP